MALQLPENPTDQDIMNYYLEKITSDYRTCYTGLDLLKSGFETGNINSMISVMKEFFVGVGLMNLVDFAELEELRPGLLEQNLVFIEREDKYYSMQRRGVSEVNLSFKDCICEVEISSGMICKIQAYNSLLTIRAHGTSHFEMKYGGEESEIDIILYGTASGILTNLNKAGPYSITQEGAGSFKYLEATF